MFEERVQEQETLAAERGRSPSAAASVGGPAELPAVSLPQLASSALDPSAVTASPPVSPATESSASGIPQEDKKGDAALFSRPFPIGFNRRADFTARRVTTARRLPTGWYNSSSRPAVRQTWRLRYADPWPGLGGGA